MNSRMKALPATIALTVALSCGSASAQDITIAAGPSGGTFDVVAAAAVQILQKAKGLKNARFSIVPGGSVVNVKLLERGKVNVAIVPGDTVLADKHDQLRGMMALYPNTLQVWATAASGIKDISDLPGKSLTYGNPGNGPYPVGKALLKLDGISGKVDVEPLSWGAANNALKDKNLDAVLWTTSYPQPTMVETMQNRDINLLQLKTATLKKFKKIRPGWINITIPAGTYRTQKKNVKTLGTVLYLAVSKDLPKKEVYAMTKALYEHRADLRDAHRLLSYITKNTAAKSIDIPLHPGAAKFYAEAGVPTK